MWYQALPTMAVISLCIFLPDPFIYVTNKLIFGNSYKRKIDNGYDCHMYRRDQRLSGTGDAYKQIGLECLPDEEPPKPAEKTC